jgi:bacterioferritin-associated ferredoxin
MFLCNCHGIRETDVDAACRAGCRTPREVIAHAADAEPCCGRCTREIRERLHERFAAIPAAAE